ncbi:hypothetical protein Y013_25810 (plasmid) [Rhodococcus pyridinivorans SB3094]|uniref:Uncharacterized protein n=1 Tax=Rhodococcus pyridinivorans SB3094 TaxID=1435356 RepID=V9XLK7_9NOCA|nr:hypothetical protein Y013_25810 [Rhodococcus pyridinivorans SB3094]
MSDSSCAAARLDGDQLSKDADESAVNIETDRSPYI